MEDKLNYFKFMELKEAIEVLIKALKENQSEGSYYYGWQSNIAMAFYDEWQHRKESAESIGCTLPTFPEVIHLIANDAAKRFLNTLCLR